MQAHLREILIARRSDAGVSQADVARAAATIDGHEKTTQPTVLKCEKGRQVIADYIVEAYATALTQAGVSVEPWDLWREAADFYERDPKGKAAEKALAIRLRIGAASRPSPPPSRPLKPSRGAGSRRSRRASSP